MPDRAAPSPESAPRRAAAATRDAYRRWRTIATRWMDNDAYGHLNNVVYYSFFDTAVNALLVEQGVLDVERGDTIGLVVETHCDFFAPLAFPQPVEAGLAVASVGRSSIRYDVGIFAAGAATSAARGHFVHVYVDRATRRPVPLPEPLRQLARTLS